MLDVTYRYRRRGMGTAFVVAFVSLSLTVACDTYAGPTQPAQVALASALSTVAGPTLPAGHASFWFELGCGAVYLGPPPTETTIHWLDVADLSTQPSGESNGANGWGRIEWSVNTSRILVAAGGNEGYSGSLCTRPDGSRGWTWGRGRGSFSLTFTLENPHHVAAQVHGAVEGVESSTEVWPAGTYTISGESFGGQGFSIDMTLTPGSPDPMEISVEPIAFEPGEDAITTARFRFRVVVTQDGEPVEGAQVLVGNLPHGLTDTDGELETSVLMLLPEAPGTRSEVVSAVVEGIRTDETVDLYTVAEVGSPQTYTVTLFEETVCTLVEFTLPDWVTALTLLVNFATPAQIPAQIPLAYALTKAYRSCPFMGDEAVTSVTSYTASPLPPRYVLAGTLVRGGQVIEESFDWFDDEASLLPAELFGSRFDRAMLGITLHSPAVIRVTTPGGLVAGYDATTLDPLFGFPALFSHLGDEPFGLLALSPVEGTYQVQIIGTGVGPYTLGIQMSDADGVGGEETVFQRDTDVGVVHEYLVTVSDGTVDVTPANQPPILTGNGAPLPVAEGSTASHTGHVYDDDGDPISLTASIGSVSGNVDGSWTWTFDVTDGPMESQTVTISASDGHGGIAGLAFPLVVQNVAPTIDAITLPTAPIAITSQPASISATFSDAGGATDGPYECWFDFGDGMGSHLGTTTGMACLGPAHEYVDPGIYQVEVSVRDKDGAQGVETAESLLVVYDPTGGFATGGGWFDSPAGAYVPDPGLSGKANFGFVSKYKKGVTVPTGNTRFHLSVGDLDFHSSSYEFLLVNQDGTTAQFQGTGSVNGQASPTGADYRFMVWAGDGQADTFRIKLWYDDGGEVVVFDNGLGQAIGGGSIVIHAR